MIRYKNEIDIRNKIGFSLLEIVVAMGLAAGLLIFYLKMEAQQVKKQKTIQTNIELDSFYNDFKSTINRPGYCNKSFENTYLNDNSFISISNIKNPLGNIRYEVGKIYGNNQIKLVSIDLKKFKPDNKEGLEGLATLEIMIEKLGAIYGTKFLKKEIEISVSRDPNYKVINCGAIGSGGVNIHINIPTAPLKNIVPSVLPEDLSKKESVKVNLIPEQNNTNTPVPAPTINDVKSQEEVLKAIEDSPQYKELLETLKLIQNQNKNETEGGL